MSLRLKTFLFIIWITAFLIMLFMMKKKRSYIRYILPWIFLDLVMCLVTAFPGILTYLCSIFGIETPSNMMFFFGMLLLVMIIFSMALAISKLNEDVRDLAQRLALYEGCKNDEACDHNTETAKDNALSRHEDSDQIEK